MPTRRKLNISLNQWFWGHEEGRNLFALQLLKKYYNLLLKCARMSLFPQTEREVDPCDPLQSCSRPGCGCCWCLLLRSNTSGWAQQPLWAVTSPTCTTPRGWSTIQTNRPPWSSRPASERGGPATVTHDRLNCGNCDAVIRTAKPTNESHLLFQALSRTAVTQWAWWTALWSWPSPGWRSATWACTTASPTSTQI